MTDNAPPPPPFPPDSPSGFTSGDPDSRRTGPAWEEPGPWFTRFAQTIQAVLLSPGAFFTTMRRQDGIGQPIAFGVLGSVIGGVVGAVYQMLLSTLMAGVQGPDAAREQAVLSLFSTGCLIVVLPVGAVVSMFVGSAIYHVMLLLLGAARRPYETTLRVSAYSTGATSLLNLIPICGGLIGGVYAIVIAIIGLARAHEISTGKAAAAVLIPVVACCVIVLLFYGALIALIMGGIMAGAQHR